MTASKPFPPDISDRNRIINDGVERVHIAHKSHIESHRIAFEKRAEQEWLRAETKRRTDFIDKFRYNNYIRPKYPYGDLTLFGQYRVSLPHDQRLDGLAAVKLYSELLLCLMARNSTGNKATIDQVREWFRPYLSVDGEYKIVSERGSTDRAQAVIDVPSANYIVHAGNLSRELSTILTDTSMIAVQFGTITWLEKDIEPSEY